MVDPYYMERLIQRIFDLYDAFDGEPTLTHGENADGRQRRIRESATAMIVAMAMLQGIRFMTDPVVVKDTNRHGSKHVLARMERDAERAIANILGMRMSSQLVNSLMDVWWNAMAWVTQHERDLFDRTIPDGLVREITQFIDMEDQRT